MIVNPRFLYTLTKALLLLFLCTVRAEGVVLSGLE